MTRAVARIKLRKEIIRKSRFIQNGCPWVFSNELTQIDTTLPVGEMVEITDPSDKVLGYGFFNPHSLIAFRLFDFGKIPSEDQVRARFFKRLDHAWVLRQISGTEIGARSFRLCYGESDGAPGLIIDLFESTPNGVAVIQSHAAGADRFIYWAQQWLEQRMGITSGVIRNDIEVRKKEGVPLEVKEWGDVSRTAFALEGGVRFSVDLKGGQKTGYFYDHRDSRFAFAKICSGLLPKLENEEFRVLDCFSYVGSWGLQVLKQNPKAKLLALDVSAEALKLVKQNAEENKLADRVSFQQIDVFKDKAFFEKDEMKEKFHAVISDPPNLMSSAKQINEGRRAHVTAFERALSCLHPNGIAAFASCSYHLSESDFLKTVADAASPQMGLQSFFTGSQAMDHPVLPSLPESKYLKCVFTRRL